MQGILRTRIVVITIDLKEPYKAEKIFFWFINHITKFNNNNLCYKTPVDGYNLVEIVCILLYFI